MLQTCFCCWLQSKVCTIHQQIITLLPVCSALGTVGCVGSGTFTLLTPLRAQHASALFGTTTASKLPFSAAKITKPAGVTAAVYAFRVLSENAYTTAQFGMCSVYKSVYTRIRVMYGSVCNNPILHPT